MDWDRRQLLHATGTVFAASLSGCAASNTQTDTTSHQPTDAAVDNPKATTPTGTPLPCTETPVNGRPNSSIYFSMAYPNPKGPDDEKLNEESVLIEMHDESITDLSGYRLLYCQKRTYIFPGIVTAIMPGDVVKIHSGTGEPRIRTTSAGDRYELYVGSGEPLLANDGMQLTLETPTGTFVDSIRYGQTEPGYAWARPE